MQPAGSVVAFLVSIVLATSAVTRAQSARSFVKSFVNWENPPLHALDVSPDGSTLAAVNLPDNRVELFSLVSGTPVPVGAVPVGLDPVSVRFRTDGEMWVINHLSDSVSVVDLARRAVVATLQTSDEIPRTSPARPSSTSTRPSTTRCATCRRASGTGRSATRGASCGTRPGAAATSPAHTVPTGMTTHERWDGSEFVSILPGPKGESHLALRPDDTTIHRGNKAQSWRNLNEKIGTDYTVLESKTGFGYMNDGREDTIVRRTMARIFNFGFDQAVADFTALVLSYSGFGVDVNSNFADPDNPPGPRGQDTQPRSASR